MNTNVVLSILCFTGLRVSEMPRGSDWQEGGFSACSVSGALGGPVLGLGEEAFLDTNLLQASCADNTRVYVRRKASAVFCILTDGTERNRL